MPESQEKLTESYFDYLAKSFPVMCASDEFHFLPRSEAASRYYDRMEILEPGLIEECIFTLREFRKNFDFLAAGEDDLERRIDLELLNSSIAGIMIELEENRLWRHNPLLYLKIAFIGLDHAISKPAGSHKEKIERTLARLCAIPGLFQQAARNVDRVPETFHQAALAMLSDCGRYLRETAQGLTAEDARRLWPALEQARSALGAFGTYLGALRPVPDRELAVPSLETTLRNRFGSDRNPSEVFEIAVEEWSENLRELESLQKDLAPGKSWMQLYHGYCPEEAGAIDTITLYQREVERLKRFFASNGFRGVVAPGLPMVCQTPTYLQSVRGSASFSAAFTKDGREKDFFYITTQAQHQRSHETRELRRKRFHREYKFLTAHETFPGHYLLDFTRRMLENPVRSQIESPLFYEGWAYYVESLLTEYGYADHATDRLVDRKRRLWRAARCQIDIGLNSGRLVHEDAMKLLTTAGFSPEEARGQIDRFGLNPGYQLCYSLGRFEILRLREAYAGQMGHDAFHALLLEGGELPFHLIEKRLRRTDRPH
ncbi:MAG: DUF885 family protein [Syntrophobacteraceae bacterium]|jgi:uncharacterized protein (DUF885 family)